MLANSPSTGKEDAMVQIFETPQYEKMAGYSDSFYQFWRCELEKMGALQILQWSVENFTPKLALETDFSMNSIVVIAMLSQMKYELKTIYCFHKRQTHDDFDAVLIDTTVDKETGRREPILRWDDRRNLFVIAPIARWNEDMIRNKIIRDSFPEISIDLQKGNMTCLDLDLMEW